MSSSNTIETVEIVDKWLWDTLSGDATLSGMVNGRISGTLSDRVLETPYVHFSYQSDRNITAIGGEIISVDCRYLVKAVGKTSSWGTILPMAKRIQELIHRPYQTFQVTGVGSLTTIRESVVQQPESDSGIQYRHLGGIYRIRASADD